MRAMPVSVPESLAVLDQGAATQRYSDQRNLVALYFAGTFLLLEVLSGFVLWRSSGHASWLLLCLMLVPAVIIIRTCWILRRPPERRRYASALEQRAVEYFDRSLRSFVLGSYLLICTVISIRWIFRSNDQPILALILLTIALRISVTERLMIHLGLLLVAVSISFARPDDGLAGTDGPMVTVAIYVVITIVSFLLGWLLTRGFTKNFITEWAPAQKSVRDQQRMREELELARSIQLSMLPRALPEVSGVDVAAVSLPATEVGGDYYDFFVRNGAFSVVQADVAGHGVGSAIVLSGVRSGLRLLTADVDDPRQIFRRLDELVRDTRSERMLVTMCMVSLDVERRTASVISAGHPPVLHWKRRTGTVDVVLLPSLPLGTGLAQDPVVATLALEAGDRLLIHSDGAYETRDAEDQEFGLERLSAALAAGGSDASAEGTLETVLEALQRFRGHARQEDDVTIVVLDVGGRAKK